MSGSMNPLTDDERAACAVCADLLAGARHLTLPSVALFLGGLTAVLLRTSPASPAVTALSALLGLAFALERYLARRLDLDARLFDRLARAELNLDTLDAGLHQVLHVAPRKAGRAVALRIAGAKRLHRGHLVAVGALVALTTLTAWLAR